MRHGVRFRPAFQLQQHPDVSIITTFLPRALVFAGLGISDTMPETLSQDLITYLLMQNGIPAASSSGTMHLNMQSIHQREHLYQHLLVR